MRSATSKAGSMLSGPRRGGGPARHGWTHRRLRVYRKRDSGASMALPKGGERGEGMADAKSFPEVPVEKLRWRCGPGAFPLQPTEEVSCSESTIGQDRAIKAIRLGLSVPSRGHNIYVPGLS